MYQYYYSVISDDVDVHRTLYDVRCTLYDVHLKCTGVNVRCGCQRVNVNESNPVIY